MFKAARWRRDKNKIEAVFKLHFQATQVPQLGWDSLLVSLAPMEVGKPKSKSEKAAIQEGNCLWENPIYETVRFTKDSKSGKLNKKIYRLLILTGSLKGGLLGEVTIDFADYAEAIEPSSVSLPLQASNSSVVLHATIQRIQTAVNGRDVEENVGVTVRSHCHTLKSQLSDWDTDESYNTSSANGNANSNMDSSSVTGTLQSSLSDDKTSSPHCKSDGIMRTSSFSDSRSASSSGSGHDTLQELGFKNYSVHHDMPQLPLSVSKDAMPERIATVPAVTDVRQQQRLNMDCSVSSALDGSLDDSTNSSEDTLLKEKLQGSDISIEKLKNEMMILVRQAEVSELELQTLRKQFVKERHNVQDLSREVSNLKKERDRLQSECERFKSLQQNSKCEKVSNGLTFETKDLRSLLEEIEQELDYAKDLNSNLQLQLQKTQESNSELVCTVRCLEELLENKNHRVREEELRNSSQLTLRSEMNEEDQDVPISNLEYSLKWKVVHLCSEIDSYKKDREELEMQMEQLALDYEILKQENHAMSLKLEQSRLQEQLTMPFECSIHLPVIHDLESHVQSLERELEKQAEMFEADLAAIGRAKVKQEQRAIRAEEELRKTRWKNVNMIEHLQEEFNRLAMQMSSALDVSEKQAIQAVTEANELRLQKVHQEDLLAKAHEELVLAKYQCEAKLKELSNLIDFGTKQTDERRLDLEGNSNELETLKKSKGELEMAFLEEIALIRTELERQERGKTNLSEGAREETWKLLKQGNEMMHIKDENEMMVGTLQSEAERYPDVYSRKQNYLLKDELEDDSLRKQGESVNEAVVENTTLLFSKKEKHLCSNIGEVEKVTGDTSQNNAYCEDRFQKISNLKDVEDGNRSTDNFGDGRNKAENLTETEMRAKVCIPDQNDSDMAPTRSTDASNIGDLKNSTSHSVNNDNDAELQREMASSKERNKSMEYELKEMQERYSEMSLEVADVQGEAQHIVIRVHCLMNANVN